MTLSIPRSLALVPLVACAASCGAEVRPAPVAPAARTSAAPKPAAAKPRPAPAAERFDRLVRDDFFAGFLRQDMAALDRAIRFCEDTLARDPSHPEALVWHGGSLVVRAGSLFRTGDRATAQTLYDQGLAEMDRAVELGPERLGTRIPRGAVLLAAAPFAPEPQRSRLLEKAVGDYEKVLALQRSTFDSLPRHAKTQLLYGLADGWQRRGDAGKARGYYEKLAAVAGDSAYGARARAYLAGDTEPRRLACGGCHAE